LFFSGFTPVWDAARRTRATDTRDERAFGLCHTPRRGGRLVFDVIVRDALGESPHQITMHANDAERWAKLGAEPAPYVEAVMRFSSIASRRN
jgi:hypothetical protein